MCVNISRTFFWCSQAGRCKFWHVSKRDRRQDDRFFIPSARTLFLPSSTKDEERLDQGGRGLFFCSPPIRSGSGLVVRFHSTVGSGVSASKSRLRSASRSSRPSRSRCTAQRPGSPESSFMQSRQAAPTPLPEHTLSTHDVKDGAGMPHNQNACLHAQQPDQQSA